MNRPVRVACLGLLLLVGVIGVASAQDAMIPNEEIKPTAWLPPVYPQIAQAARVQGNVVVLATLDDQGKVTGVSAVSGSALFIQVALANATTWTFTPNARKKAVIIYQFVLGEQTCGKDRVPDTKVTLGNVMTVSACAPVIDVSTTQTTSR